MEAREVLLGSCHFAALSLQTQQGRREIAVITEVCFSAASL